MIMQYIMIYNDVTFAAEIQKALCNPGPDLVVCDEGHRIKNDYSNISQALKRIRTRCVASERERERERERD